MTLTFNQGGCEPGKWVVGVGLAQRFAERTSDRERAGNLLALGALASYGPIFWLARNVANQPEYGIAFLVTAASVLLAQIGYSLMRPRLGPARAFALSAAGIVCFWNWPSFNVSIGSIPIWTTSALLVSIVLIAAWVNAGTGTFRRLAVLSSVSLLLTASALMAYRVMDIEMDHGSVTVEPRQLVHTAPMGQLPDIHVIVLDGYARADVLKNLFEFSNDEIIRHLRNDGFVVDDFATSNYSMTHYALPALLQADYVTLPDADLGPADHSALRAMMSGNNSTVVTLKEFGYSFVHADTSWWGSKCGAEADVCIGGAVLDETGWHMLRGTPLGPLISRGAPGIDLAVGRLALVEDWKRARASWPSGPIFSFFHLALPHPPFLLDPACRLRGDEPPPPTDIDLIRAHYVDQLQCANVLIRAFSEQIADDDILVLMSDHGPETHRALALNRRDWQLALHERMSILLAIRLPGECSQQQVPNGLATVNVMRVVINCALGAQLPLRESRHFLVPATGEYRRVIEVSDPDELPLASL